MDISGRHFGVIGGARSGLAVARLLKRHGAEVFVSDNAPAEKLGQAGYELSSLGIDYEFGANSLRVLSCDAIVVSPGVPADASIVKEARGKGLLIFGEIEAASWFCSGSIIAITGTNGKTTTTALTGRMFEDAHKPSAVGGNIGVAFSEVVEGMTGNQTAILEVSSFQLDTIDTFRPKVSALLNITPDHLDRYDHSMDLYVASKCRIFKNQRGGDAIVYNYDDKLVRNNVEKHVHPGVRKLPFSLQSKLEEGAYIDGHSFVTDVAGWKNDVIALDEIGIKGKHNLMNAMAATLVAQSANIPVASLRATLRNFKGVEHRLEFVRKLDGISYINDSKATNVDSVWFALQSFAEPIIVMLGGRDKGNNYSVLFPLVEKHVKAIVAIGESAGKVMTAFDGLKPMSRAMTMKDAVEQARGFASVGDVVLLSPACASFDWFDNYEHRGKVFKELVMDLQ